MKWPCAVGTCHQPTLRTLLGQCEQCHLHFCAKHSVSASHRCLTMEDINAIYLSRDQIRIRELSTARRAANEQMIANLLNSINADALRERATFLRDGINCTVNLPGARQACFNDEVVGGRNYHSSIVFEDGNIWLARFRLPNHNAPPLQERNFDRRGEFATYRYLAEASVPVPAVYDLADDDDPLNPVGAGYILLDKLAGRPLAWHEANEVQKEKLTGQLADIYAQLEKHPVTWLGRLQPSPTGSVEAGPAFFDYDSNGNLVPSGPFSNLNDYYVALIQHQIQLIRTGEIAPSAPLDQYLVYRSLLDCLPPDESGPFFLRHIDSRDANFLVDDEYNITGIIDWELAIVTAKGAAFQSPLMLYDLVELYNQGLSTPSEEEKRLSRALQKKGLQELSALADKKLHFRVDQVIETDPENRQIFTSVFSGWWKVVNGSEEFDWDTWYRQALEKYGDGGLTHSPA